MTKQVTAAHFALGTLVGITLTIGAVVALIPEAALLRSWITPLCIVTAVSATVVAKVRTRALTQRH